MASNPNPTGTMSPPPPPLAGAVGQPPFDANQSNGAQMAPPLVPALNIPANNGSMPPPTSSIMSAMTPGVMSPGGTVRRAAPDVNKRALYVGGLDPRVTEDVLLKIFETTGHVQSVKVIPDKMAKGFNYGFVEYDDPAAAERAMQSLNGRRVHSNEIRVNWAYQSTNLTKEDTSGHYHIFVGDLSNEVNDEVLLQAFSTFGTVSEARVMWDMKTGRSRGYGFVAFHDRAEADKALTAMDGEWLGSRAIRCNWANQKGQPSFNQQASMSAMGMTPTTPMNHHQFPSQGAQSYDMVVQQTPQWQTTCYVGNLTPYTSQNDLVPLFQNFGYVVETRFQSDRGFAFIKMDSHENAANAICQLNGYNVNGRPLKCSWGKDRPPTGQFEFSPNGAAGGPHSAFPPTPSAYGFPQYGSGPQSALSPNGMPAGYGQSPAAYHPQQPGGFGAMPPPPMPQQVQGQVGGFGRPGGYMGQQGVTSPYGAYTGGYQA